MCGCTRATCRSTGEALVDAARGCQVIISDRQAAAPAELFRQLPELAVFQRCAVDMRNIDLAAASAAGVLVTHASAGFGNAVAEWVLGAMIDLARHLTDSRDGLPRRRAAAGADGQRTARRDAGRDRLRRHRAAPGRDRRRPSACACWSPTPLPRLPRRSRP